MLPIRELEAYGCTSDVESGDKKYSELNLVILINDLHSYLQCSKLHFSLTCQSWILLVLDDF